MKKKCYFRNLFAIFVIAFCYGAITSCGDDDTKTKEDSKEVNVPNRNLIYGDWIFEINPDDDQRPEHIIFFDNGMFYEYSYHLSDYYSPHKSRFEKYEPGYYTISESEVTLKSLYPTGSFYEMEKNTKLIDISEESFTFLFENNLYDGKKWHKNKEYWLKVEYNNRKDIIGTWLVDKWDYSGNKSLGDIALAKFKDDGTFEYTIDGITFPGIYSICEDELAIYDETGKNPFTGLFEIINIYDAYG